MKYRLPRKLKKAVKGCFIISDIETNVTLSSVRTVGNITYIGRHTKYTHKAIKWLRQREYNKFSEWLTKSLKDLYANDIEKALETETKLLAIYKIGKDEIKERTILDIIE